MRIRIQTLLPALFIAFAHSFAFAQTTTRDEQMAKHAEEVLTPGRGGRSPFVLRLGREAQIPEVPREAFTIILEGWWNYVALRDKECAPFEVLKRTRLYFPEVTPEQVATIWAKMNKIAQLELGNNYDVILPKHVTKLKEEMTVEEEARAVLKEDVQLRGYINELSKARDRLKYPSWEKQQHHEEMYGQLQSYCKSQFSKEVAETILKFVNDRIRVKNFDTLRVTLSVDLPTAQANVQRNARYSMRSQLPEKGATLKTSENEAVGRLNDTHPREVRRGEELKEVKKDPK